MTSTRSQQFDDKPEIYFTSKDFSNLYNRYHRDPQQFPNSKPYKLLLAAKACFFMGKYKQCLEAIQNIQPGISTKVLYERQTLQIKASYLMNPSNLQDIFKAQGVFEQYKARCPGVPLSRTHSINIQLLIQVIKKRRQIIEQTQGLDKEQFKNLIYKKQKQQKLQGMPSFLISKDWNDKFNDFIRKQDKQNPGPITNFELLNHIFQFQQPLNKSKMYMDTLLFPGKEDTHYHVVTKNHWKQLEKIFNGYPVQRLFIKDRRFRSVTGDDTSIKVLFQYRNQDIFQVIMQWQQGTYWQRSVLPCMIKVFGRGQLKEQTQNGEYLIVQPGKVYQPTKKLKYVNINQRLIKAETKEQLLRRERIIMSFDLEEYHVADSQSYGKVGLENLGNTCYMNSGLQCLSHISQFSKYFVENQYLQSINLSDSNVCGSFGVLTCALADILKRLWFCSQNTGYINPVPFKRVFGERFRDFQGNQQQDAQQFLMFLLNCLHDDLNQNSQVMLRRQSTTNRNFEQVRRNTISHHAKHNRSIISRSFHGFHSQTIKCDYCHHQVVKFEDFMMFHVQIPLDSPKLTLFYVPGQKLGEKALKLQINLDQITQFHQVAEIIRKQLKVNSDNELKAYLLDDTFIFKQEIQNETKVKKLYQKTSMFVKNNMVFVYEIMEQQKDEELFLVTYYYQGRRADCHEIDGYPRIIVAKNQIKSKDKQQQLFNVAVKTIPSAIYQRSKQRQIASVSVKNAKGAAYQAVISVKTKENISSFTFQKYAKQLGKQQEEVYTLQSCIKNMSQPEAISEEEAWLCSKCKQTRPAHRTDKINSTSKILLIDLKRFTTRKKILTKIEYPVKNFDITPLISDQSVRRVYNLRSVILHRGSLHAGHYTAYCQSTKDNNWYHYDDQSVREIDQAAVVDASAYILVYEKI